MLPEYSGQRTSTVEEWRGEAPKALNRCKRMQSAMFE